MNKDFTFTIKSTLFDENYNPSESTRITTNFANLARGKKSAGEFAQHLNHDRQSVQYAGALG